MTTGRGRNTNSSSRIHNLFDDINFWLHGRGRSRRRSIIRWFIMVTIESIYKEGLTESQYNWPLSSFSWALQKLLLLDSYLFIVVQRRCIPTSSSTFIVDNYHIQSREYQDIPHIWPSLLLLGSSPHRSLHYQTAIVDLWQEYQIHRYRTHFQPPSSQQSSCS